MQLTRSRSRESGQPSPRNLAELKWQFRDVVAEALPETVELAQLWFFDHVDSDPHHDDALIESDAPLGLWFLDVGDREDTDRQI